jgi:hypothetical protein
MSPTNGRPKAGDIPAGDRERPVAASAGRS